MEMGRDERGRASGAALRSGWGAGAAGPGRTGSPGLARAGSPDLARDGSSGRPGRRRPSPGTARQRSAGPAGGQGGSREPGTVAPSAAAPWGGRGNPPWEGDGAGTPLAPDPRGRAGLGTGVKPHLSLPSARSRTGRTGRRRVSPGRGHERPAPSMGAGSWVGSAPVGPGAAAGPAQGSGRPAPR